MPHLPTMNRILHRNLLFVITFLLMLTLSKGFAQNSYADQFDNLSFPGDSSRMQALLVQWESANPNDPELYVKCINYYIAKSIISYVGISQEPGENGFALEDSTGTTAGYLSDKTHINRDILNIGLHYIDKGISLFPDRLDMRFGKIFTLGKVGDWEMFTSEIVKTIHFADSLKYRLRWKNHEPLQDSVAFMLGTVQQYILQLYDEGDEYLPHMRRIAEAALIYHPDDVRFLSDVAITYSLQNEPAKALVPLLKAEKIAPNDFIVLNNIARTYEMLGDRDKTIHYYELTLKYGDERAQELAKRKLKEWKKKKA